MTNIEKKLQSIPELDEDTRLRILSWMQGDIDEASKKEVLDLIDTNHAGLVDAFYTVLSFGTGGLRGIMGPGSNRMNEYTVSYATQGLANYMKKSLPEALHRVAIGYDSRHRSQEFAQVAAQVLAGNGITVFLFEALRPTPLVSFACRHKKCGAAIMVTASHNPPHYNGYKVYWSDGAQVLPPHDKGIIEEVQKITSRSEVHLSSFPHSQIHMMGPEVDRAYLEAIQPLRLLSQESYPSLKILYSNLHGTGCTMVPQALARFGFHDIGYVEEQKEPDGSFPTTSTPNPEERSALALGIQKMEKEGYELFMATDPDCDRIGVVCMHAGKPVLLTGNEVACLACDFVCRMSPDMASSAMVKTIVTSDLFRVICEKYHVECVEVLTGFKYIAEKIREWEQQGDKPRYLFGGEESYGYLLGTHVRDKDAVISACLIAEMARAAKKEKKSLVDCLHDLYQSYGVFREGQVTIAFEEGKVGKERQQALLKSFREHPVQSIAGLQVVRFGDYLSQKVRDLASGVEIDIHLPRSDVLLFELEDGSKVFIRPSGTEPKTKVYLMARNSGYTGSLSDAILDCDKKLQKMRQDMLAFTQS